MNRRNKVKWPSWILGLGVLLAFGCSPTGSSKCGRGAEEASCQSTSDCQCGYQCYSGVCTKTPDGGTDFDATGQDPSDVVEDGGSGSDGGSGESDATDGSSSDGDVMDTTGSDLLPDEDTKEAAVFEECSTAADCPAEMPECTPQGYCVLCYPGTKSCNGGKLMVCLGEASGFELQEDCGASGKSCNPDVGACESPCGGFAKVAGTNVGCDFFAVDLHNAQEATSAKFLDAQNAQFAVIASNTDDQAAADVILYLPNGTQQSASIAPKSLHTFLLPSDYGLAGTVRGFAAYRLQSNIPIVAYQFNPLSNVDVFSNDASVLMPVIEQGNEYYVMTREHYNAGGDKNYAGYVTVVGIQGPATEVTVKVTAATSSGGDIPALNVGGTHTFEIDEGEVVNIETVSGDLTGSKVTSNAPIMVFAGHVGSKTSTECCADHLEQQMAPVSSWGKEFVMGRSMERGSESDYVRVLAAHNNTVVTVTKNGVPATFSLSAGQFQEFTTNAHLKISANKAIMAAQFLASKNEIGIASGPCNSAADCGQAYKCEPFSSSSAVDVCLAKECTTSEECGPGYSCAADLTGATFKKKCKPIGDPAMITVVPIEQWQTDYVFLTPDSYLQDFVNIVSPKVAQVYLDSQLLPDNQFEDIAGTDYRVYRGLVADGTHTISAEAPVSIVVYGYDHAVSYGYPGGLGLKSL